MITGDVKNIKIAKKYSNAYYEMAKSNNKQEQIYNDLLFINETISANQQLNDFLTSPLIKNEDKKEVITKLFSIHTDKLTLEFLYLLTDNNRLNILKEILNQYAKIYNTENNIIKPIIISAVELNEIQKNKLNEKLEDKLSKKVIPAYQIDKEIIGGIIIEIEDKTIDCSIKTKFENMKKQLIKGNKYGSD